MSAHAIPVEPHTIPGPQAEDDQFYHEILHGLIEVGAELVRHLPQQAAAQAQAPQQHPAPQPAPAPAPSSDAVASLAIAYDRISRAVRRCIALARSLNDPAQPPKHPAPDRTAARKHILRAVEDTLQRQDYDDSYRDCDSTEALHAELLDRMDTPDLDRDIESRPIDDIIKDILRDLGLAALPGTRPWKRRTPADIAELNARAAAPSRPAGSTPTNPAPARKTATPPPPPSGRPISNRTSANPAIPPTPARSPAPSTPVPACRRTRPKPSPSSCTTPPAPAPDGARRPAANQSPR
jgi:hypothetical protein